MENPIAREPTTTTITTSVPISSPTSLSPVDDDHVRPNPRSPSFSTDFLERNAGADLNHSQPLRVHSLVRKLGTAALAQNSDDGHSSRSVAAGSVAPDAPFALRPGVLDLSEDESEHEHQPQQEVSVTGNATDGLSEVASTVADTRPITKTSKESTHASIFGPSSSTAAYGPAAAPAPAPASASSSASVSAPALAPASASASASATTTASASASTPVAAVQQPIVQAPDASAAIGTMPAFPRGIGPAPGETGFSSTSKNKTKKFSFLQLLRLKPKAPPEAPAAMSAAEKRALAAKERDNRIKEAEAAKRKKAATPTEIATPTDIAPSRNPAVIRTQKEELLGRKKSHLREAKTELTLAQKDVALLMESIGELEGELAASATATATATATV